MTVLYDTDSVADFDELIDAIEAVADAAGWTTVKETTMDGENPAGGANAGQILTLDHGDNFFVRLQSVANVRTMSIPSSGPSPNIDGPGVLCGAYYDDGVNPVTSVPSSIFGSKYIGPATYRSVNPAQQPLEDGWIAPTFPATYHIFAPDNPDCIFVVVQTNPTQYQWIKFGQLVKFGTWTGGGFYGATMSRASTSGGNFPRQPTYSVSGESSVHSHAPWHRMRSNFNAAENPDGTSNTHVHCVTGTSEPEIDDVPWTYNSIVDPGSLGGDAPDRREAIANVYQNPINQRSPNSFNQVGVMVPYWLVTQRASHRAVIGRVPHCRHLPIDNFNAGDTFELGNDEWMVFPYFERDGLTGRYGWAIKKSDGS